jgi:nickel-dependent lactate racemase
MIAERTQTATLRTGAWYGDRSESLEFPSSWRVTIHRPQTPPPLADAQIAASLESPVGQEPIRALARGKSRPLILVDDLTRPTPADRVLPLLLRQLEEAGIRSGDVRIMLAQGTHEHAPGDALARKVGSEAARACRLLVHDHRAATVRVGRTSLGTPVCVNPEVMAADLLIGVGGVYPQRSTGFGGGSKLALGVLGRPSIVHLHYARPSMDGSYDIDNEFRRDLDEIAAMIGLRTMVTVHVDGERRIVRAVSGDHFAFYREAAAFSRFAYSAPPPGDVDVVISNAYPLDVSLTFMRSKGMAPLFKSEPSASRVVVAACSEGIGNHGLFPFVNAPRFDGLRQRVRRASVMPPQTLLTEAARGMRRVTSRLSGTHLPGASQAAAGRRRRGPIHLYSPVGGAAGLPSEIPIWTGQPDRITVAPSWAEVLRHLSSEQGGREALDVVVYSCASMQVIE